VVLHPGDPAGGVQRRRSARPRTRNDQDSATGGSSTPSAAFRAGPCRSCSTPVFDAVRASAEASRPDDQTLLVARARPRPASDGPSRAVGRRPPRAGRARRQQLPVDRGSQDLLHLPTLRQLIDSLSTSTGLSGSGDRRSLDTIPADDSGDEMSIGVSEALRKNASKVTFFSISSRSGPVSKPVNHSMTLCSSSFVSAFLLYLLDVNMG